MLTESDIDTAWRSVDYTMPYEDFRVAIGRAIEAAVMEKLQAQSTYGWLIACDEEMVSAHLGVAELSHSYETAKKKLSELIQWHVAVATDPAVNGGFSLQPVQAQSEPVMFAYQYDDGTWHDASATEHSAGMKPLFAAPVQAQSEPVAWMGAYDNTDLYYRKPTQADVVPLYRHPAPVQQEPVGRVLECAKRLVEHADFKLGGILSADSKAKDIPSNAISQVKARHLAALRDAIAVAPVQQDVNQQLLEALKEVWLWMENQYDGQSKGGHATFDMMMLREHRDIARAAIAAVEGKHV